MSPEARLLHALTYCREMAELGVSPTWCLESAAHHECVDEALLAKCWLTTTIAAVRARRDLAAMSDGDEEVKHEQDRYASPHAPATRAARKRMKKASADES
jgi:hypothetical protein